MSSCGKGTLLVHTRRAGAARQRRAPKPRRTKGDQQRTEPPANASALGAAVAAAASCCPARRSFGSSCRYPAERRCRAVGWPTVEGAGAGAGPGCTAPAARPALSTPSAQREEPDTDTAPALMGLVCGRSRRLRRVLIALRWRLLHRQYVGRSVHSILGPNARNATRHQTRKQSNRGTSHIRLLSWQTGESVILVTEIVAPAAAVSRNRPRPAFSATKRRDDPRYPCVYQRCVFSQTAASRRNRQGLVIEWASAPKCAGWEKSSASVDGGRCGENSATALATINSSHFSPRWGRHSSLPPKNPANLADQECLPHRDVPLLPVR